MSALIYTTASGEDLPGIIELQKNNLPINLKADDISAQGFVTVTHNLAALKKLNDIEPHIICKDDEKVVAYLLAMTSRSKKDIPVLIPMFEIFNELSYKSRLISCYDYIVVGQVCVDKNNRGKGVLDNCYGTYRECFKKKYDFAITEIACRNLRSINAHKRIGFREVHQYIAPDKESWSIVVWDW